MGIFNALRVDAGWTSIMSNPSFMIFLVISIALKVNFLIAGKSGGRTGYHVCASLYPLFS